ncbi:MAG: hypothetical protein ACHQ4H_02485, partial [Ktedonobacterales bacterium]
MMRKHWDVTGWVTARRAPLLAAGIIGLAAALRLGLLRAGWPGTDSDDSTMGLMALHILSAGEHPLFFYGQAYMGTIEAYLGAAGFAIMGVSVFALKSGLVVLYAAFLAALYLLLARVFSRGWALAGLLLLSFGADEMLYHQLNAYGGYLETLFFGTVLLVLTAAMVADGGKTSSPSQRSMEAERDPSSARSTLDAVEGRQSRVRSTSLPAAGGQAIRPQPVASLEHARGVSPTYSPRRQFQRRAKYAIASKGHGIRLGAAFAGWGLAAGLGLWSDPLVAPFVVLTGAALGVTRWRELRGWLGALALAGLLLGLAPWGVYAVMSPSFDAAKSFLQRAPSTTSQALAPRTAAPAPSLAETVRDRALGTLLIAVPNATGATAVCPLTVSDSWPQDRWKTPAIRACIAVRGVWGSAFVLLLGLALALELQVAVALLRIRPARWSHKERLAASRTLVRVCALGAPALTIALFAASSAAERSPWIFSRYLITALIVLPVMLATLWEHAPRLSPLTPWRRRLPRLSLAIL